TIIVNKHRGGRNTSANWAKCGFPPLLDFQQKTAKDIAKRTHEAYSMTGAYQCARMLSEFSMRCATEEEQTAFEERSEKVYKYAYYIDDVMNRYQHWNDGIVYNIYGWESRANTLHCVSGATPTFFLVYQNSGYAPMLSPKSASARRELACMQPKTTH